MSILKVLTGKKKVCEHNWIFMRTDLNDACDISWFSCSKCLEQAKTTYSEKTGAIEMVYYKKKAPVHLAGIPDKK